MGGAMGGERAADPAGRLSRVFVVILAGGRGERFWPLSTRTRPKPFLRLVGNETLLQATARRARALVPWTQILVVAGRAHADLVREQLPELPGGNLLLEPVQRDTAAAIGFASLELERRDGNATMVVLPADHHVPDLEAFASSLRAGLALLESGPSWVVTLGVPPTRPETGYGYLEAGETLPPLPGAFRVGRFLEKPDPDTAAALVRGGRHFWNSGVFLWRNATIQELLSRHMPQVWAGLCRIRDARWDEEVLAREFAEFSGLSVDYGVLEHVGEGVVAMVRAAFAWDDLGSWDALARVLPSEQHGNAVVGDVQCLESRGSLIFSAAQRVAAIGVSEMIVVTTADGILICPKGRSHELKRLALETP
jgi:mannose-1-phosphate guanylyltransferase